MMKKMLGLCCLFVAAPLMSFSQPAGAPDMQEAMKALGMLMGGGASTGTAPASVHFRQLKALLPESYDGLKRTSVEAGKNAAFGMNISHAKAEYSDDQATLNIQIQDVGAMGPFMKMAQFAWAQTEMERETDAGYERTTKLGGHPAQESYDNRSQRGSVQVMVDGRFVVEADGANVPMERIHGLINAIGLDNLAALQPEE
jgi:hypothetical protein